MLASMAETLLLRGVEYLERPGDSVQFLGRTVSRVAGGFDLKVNRRLAEEIVADAGVLGKRTSGVPGSKDPVQDRTPVSSRDHSYYRTQVGRLIFYTQYRPDMQYAVGQLSRHLAAPCVCHMVALKRCVRYLASTLDRVLQLRPRRGDIACDAHSDADWAGLADRKSVSGAMIYINDALLMSFSRTQNARSLSSCESELYAMGSTSTEALWIAGLLREVFGVTVVPTIHGDSSSALELSSRAGMGRLKHVEIKLFALQDWHAQGRLTLAKIGTRDNTADLATKYLSAADTLRFSEQIGVKSACDG